MTYETLQVRRDGYVQIIGLNRPDKRNAFDSTMLRELAAAYGELDADDTLRAGVLYGEGTMFTAGLDLASVAGDIQSNVSHVPEGGINPWQVDGRQLSKPLVVAVHGKVLTLGIELMLAADIAVAAESATFAQLEIARGIYPFGAQPSASPAPQAGATRCGGCSPPTPSTRPRPTASASCRKSCLTATT